jgi:hypothetical protein
MDWPDNVDGDVLRRTEAQGLDFSTPHRIDFDVDFESWPPSLEAIEALEGRFGHVEVMDEGASGYLHFELHDRVTYDLVMATQRVASELMRPFGGVCEAWGVLVEPRVA